MNKLKLKIKKLVTEIIKENSIDWVDRIPLFSKTPPNDRIFLSYNKKMDDIQDEINKVIDKEGDVPEGYIKGDKALAENIILWFDGAYIKNNIKVFPTLEKWIETMEEQENFKSKYLIPKLKRALDKKWIKLNPKLNIDILKSK